MTSPRASIRLVIADDHALVREGLRKLFDSEAGIEVVGEAGNGVEALERAKDLKPDILLLDLAMPRMNGLQVLREMGELTEQVKTILLTASIEPEETVQSLRLGARGVVLKECATQVLYQSICAVLQGGFWVGQDRLGDVVKALRQAESDAARRALPASTVTARERQVIAAVVDGATNKDIGASLGLSEQTVKNHLSHIYDKLGVSNRLELALYVVHHQMLAGEGDAPSVTPRTR